MLYKIEFKKNETKEAQAKSPWGIIKVSWGSKIYYPWYISEKG